MSEHRELIEQARAEIEHWKAIVLAHDFQPVGVTTGEFVQLLTNYTRLADALETSEPCRCDPPGSGEEYCHGGCEIRDQLSAAEVPT